MSEPYWKNEREWVCPKHLPSVKLPANIDKCFFSGCKSVRPPNRPGNTAISATPKKKKIVVVASPPTKSKTVSSTEKVAVEAALCAWFKCEKGENGGRAVVRSNSKYCSRDCSNRNARWRHKQRKK